MKIVIAMDSFKGRLSALEACELVRVGLLQVVPDLELLLLPMADGGEGTAQAMIAAMKGEWIPAQVMGPLPDMSVDAGYVWFPDLHLALIEMAVASGLPLLPDDKRNPLLTTTYGTGQLMQCAIKKGAQSLMLTVGGSATVDGGVGAAMALGWKFLNRNHESVSYGGAALSEIVTIQAPDKPLDIPVKVLCDVTNPLCGERGAAQVYGPQKGATSEMVVQLEKGLLYLANLVDEQLGISVCDVPGAGAAGGLAAGAVAFMKGELVSGIDTVMQVSGLREALKDADWIIAGEGKFDDQSLQGKVVEGITRMAADTKTKVAVLAGCVMLDDKDVWPTALHVVKATMKPGMSLPEAIAKGDELLVATANEFAREELMI